MEDIGTKMEEVVKNLKEYADIQYQLAVLKAGKAISNVTAKFFAACIVAFVVFIFTIIVSVAAGFYLSNMLGSLVKGFFVVAGFYFLLGILLIIFREKLIVGPMKNSLIKHMFNHED